MRCQAVGSVAQQKGAVRAISQRQTRQKEGGLLSVLVLVEPSREANGRPAEPPADSAFIGTPDQPTPRLDLGTWAGPFLPLCPLPPHPHLAPGTWHPAKPHPAPTPGFRATTPPSYKPCGSRCPFRPRPQGPASHARAHTHTRPSPFALTDLSGPSSSPAPE